VDLGLKDRVAVVLAGSKGLGRGAAEALAGEGCHLAMCARGQPELEAAAEDIRRQTGRDVLPVVCDVADAAALDRFFAAVHEKFGRVDVLVNNAGGPPAGDATAFADADWLAACQQTLMSVVRACRHVVDGMKQRRWGRILNITSVSVKEPLAGMALSNTFRPAVAGFAKSLAAELASHNVLVHCLMPGSFLTDRNRALGTAIAEKRGIDFEQLVGEWEQTVPVRRMGQPSEFGALVAFLASDRCTFSTGSCIAIEGGGIRSLA
jgi:3-oxoacyl-[acyl-carrier protein] reductase